MNNITQPPGFVMYDHFTKSYSFIHTMNEFCSKSKKINSPYDFLKVYQQNGVEWYKNNKYGINSGYFHFSDDIIETHNADCTEISTMFMDFSFRKEIKSTIAFASPVIISTEPKFQLKALVGHAFPIFYYENPELKRYGYGVLHYLEYGAGFIIDDFKSIEEAAYVFGEYCSNHILMDFGEEYKDACIFYTYLKDEDLNKLKYIIKRKEKQMQNDIINNFTVMEKELNDMIRKQSFYILKMQDKNQMLNEATSGRLNIPKIKLSDIGYNRRPTLNQYNKMLRAIKIGKQHLFIPNVKRIKAK